MGFYIACYLTCRTAACRAPRTLPQGSRLNNRPTTGQAASLRLNRKLPAEL